MSKVAMTGSVWFNLSTSVVAEGSSALGLSSGVVRMWVWIPAWPVVELVSLSKTLNHNCFVLPMGCKAVGPVCCVMHVKEPRILIVKEKGLAPVFLDSLSTQQGGYVCATNLLYYYYYLFLEKWLFCNHQSVYLYSLQWGGGGWHFDYLWERFCLD